MIYENEGKFYTLGPYEIFSVGHFYTTIYARSISIPTIPYTIIIKKGASNNFISEKFSFV